MSNIFFIIEYNEHVRGNLCFYAAVCRLRNVRRGDRHSGNRKSTFRQTRSYPVGSRSTRYDGHGYSKSDKKKLLDGPYTYYCLQRLERGGMEGRSAPGGNGRILAKTNSVRANQSKSKRIYPALASEVLWTGQVAGTDED